jgi:hypothetical protein
VGGELRADRVFGVDAWKISGCELMPLIYAPIPIHTQLEKRLPHSYANRPLQAASFSTSGGNTGITSGTAGNGFALENL